MVVGGSYVSVQRRRREREALAVAGRRERIIGLVAETGEASVLSDVAKGLDVSEDMVRVVIEETVEGGVLVGQFSNDGRTFITGETLRKQLKDRLE